VRESIWRVDFVVELALKTLDHWIHWTTECTECNESTERT